MKRPQKEPESGMTLVEVMVAALLVATFFASIFEVNGLCLRFISATKDNVAAIEGVQDRVETFRSLSFTDLTSASYMTTALTAPANSSPFVPTVSETVTLSDYLAGTPTVTYTRSPGASVAPTVTWSGGTAFPSTTSVIKATVQYSWAASLGGRSRTEKAETIIADGVKK